MLSEVERIKGRWEKADEAEITSAINALLQAPNGRRFLWWLLAVGKIGNQPFSSDPNVTAFNCGELNVGNQIMARLQEANPDGYTSMMKEMLNEHASRNAELGAAADADAGRSELDYGPGADPGTEAD